GEKSQAAGINHLRNDEVSRYETSHSANRCEPRGEVIAADEVAGNGVGDTAGHKAHRPGCSTGRVDVRHDVSSYSDRPDEDTYRRARSISLAIIQPEEKQDGRCHPRQADEQPTPRWPPPACDEAHHRDEHWSNRHFEKE